MSKSAKSHFVTITSRLGIAKRYGDYRALLAYVTSQDFVTSYSALDGKRREYVWRSLHAAHTRCLEAYNKRHGPIFRKPTGKRIKWDAANIAKIRRTTSAEAASRMFGISIEAARLARERHVLASTTVNAVGTPRMAAGADLQIQAAA